MSDYNIGFSAKLISCAQNMLERVQDSIDEERAVDYLSLLACESTLKALHKHD